MTALVSVRIWASGSLLLALVLFAQACSSNRLQEHNDYEWLADSYPQALDQLLPLEVQDGVACRLFRDLYHENHEALFHVTFGAGSEVAEVEMVRPRKDSIWTQLRKLHRRDRSASLSSLLPEIELVTEKMGHSSCPRLAVLPPFTQIRPSFDQPSPTITLHPWVRECVTAQGELPVITDDDHPVSLWLEEIANRVRSCS